MHGHLSFLTVKNTWYSRSSNAAEFLRLELIASGGLADVYRAQTHDCSEWVALKVLKRRCHSSRRCVRSFYREAYLLSLLDHENIVSIRQAGVSVHGDFFVELELLNGSTVFDSIRKELIPVRDVARFSLGVLRALRPLHDLGVAHLDIKPGNVFLHQDDGNMGNASVKLLDFGGARVVSCRDSHDRSHAAEIRPPVGRVRLHHELMSSDYPGATANYASPEQLDRYINRDSSPLDVRSDLYSVGVLTFEMLCGSPLYNLGMIRKSKWPEHVREFNLQRLGQVIGKSPLIVFIEKCLSYRPDDRWDTDAAIACLTAVLNGPEL